LTHPTLGISLFNQPFAGVVMMTSPSACQLSQRHFSDDFNEWFNQMISECGICSTFGGAQNTTPSPSLSFFF
jgi:hypothetical protein